MNESATIELPLQAGPPPLRLDEGNVIRVGKSRVSLDVLVDQYENGMTPEAMVRAYDTLALPEVYAAIGYYLDHVEAVAVYLKRRQSEAAALRSQIEAERPPLSKAKLVERRSTLESGHAAAGQ
jgi:uncharacterized protein (DUF433 family)